jgi:hypothetical protein
MGREVRELDGWSETKTTSPFTFLSLEIPPTPLFRDSEGGLIIPQIPLFQVLQKFNGETWTDQIGVNTHTRKKYIIRKLPQYLILHLVRFTKNNFFNLEKNRSVVTFPVKNLSLKDYQFPLGENTTSSSASASASASSSELESGKLIYFLVLDCSVLFFFFFCWYLLLCEKTFSSVYFDLRN